MADLQEWELSPDEDDQRALKNLSNSVYPLEVTFACLFSHPDALLAVDATHTGDKEVRLDCEFEHHLTWLSCRVNPIPLYMTFSSNIMHGIDSHAPQILTGSTVSAHLHLVIPKMVLKQPTWILTPLSAQSELSDIQKRRGLK
jgi:hypothetical protein